MEAARHRLGRCRAELLLLGCAAHGRPTAFLRLRKPVSAYLRSLRLKPRCQRAKTGCPNLFCRLGVLVPRREFLRPRGHHRSQLGRVARIGPVKPAIEQTANQPGKGNSPQ